MEQGWLMRELLGEGERGLEEASAEVHTPSPDGVSSSSLAAVEAAADAGMDEALRAERVARWKEQAEWWLEQQPRDCVFTADDLVADIGLPDTGPARNNVVGAWIRVQARQRRIEWSGELRKSLREAGHGNLQRVWRVCIAREAAA